MTQTELPEAISRLQRTIKNWKQPTVTQVALEKKSPYQVLISCLLSLRTKDNVTGESFRRLIAIAETPVEMVRLSLSTIEKTIYPVGFYRTKARVLKDVSQTILDRYDGNVPDELDELLKLKGVGRKTANLVITMGFGKLGICVDTHVHRIFNRWGYIKTKSPDETEFALRRKLPQEYWIEINDILVTFGQNLCKPVSPLCSRCPIKKFCKRVNVKKSR